MADDNLSVRVLIYKITHVESGKAYIGLTKRLDVSLRWAEHKYDASSPVRRKGPLHKAIKKYGIEAFTLTIIDTVDGLEAGLRREMELIAEHRTLKPDGFNLSTGGEGGNIGTTRIISDETREKWRQAVLRRGGIRKWTEEEKRAHGEAVVAAYEKGAYAHVDRSALAHERWARPEFRGSFKHGMLGRHHTEEVKERLAAARRGIPLPEHQRIAISKAATGKKRGPYKKKAKERADK